MVQTIGNKNPGGLKNGLFKVLNSPILPDKTPDIIPTIKGIRILIIKLLSIFLFTLPPINNM